MWVLGEASGRRLPSYATFLEKRRELPRAMIMVCIAGAPEGGWLGVWGDCELLFVW